MPVYLQENFEKEMSAPCKGLLITVFLKGISPVGTGSTLQVTEACKLAAQCIVGAQI